MRVSACTPMVSVTLRASTCGCAAAARTGRISSHSCGRPVLPPPSGIERHILAHCSRAARSMNGSLRSRVLQRRHLLVDGARRSAAAPRCAILILMPASDSALSPSVTCAVRFGSSRQLAVSAGFERTITWPRTSTFWSSTPVLVELADLLAERAAEQAGDARRLGCRPAAGELAGDLEGAVERRCTVISFGAAVHRHGAARNGHADVGLGQKAADRIVVLAGQGRAARTLRGCAGWRRARWRPARSRRRRGSPAAAAAAAQFGDACLAPASPAGKKRSSAHRVAAKKTRNDDDGQRSSGNTRERPNRRSGAVR